jgi:hypothetical protein
VACPECRSWHLPTEVCGKDTAAGLALKARLERGRAALAREVSEPPRPVERPALPVKPSGRAKSKGGRPKTAGLIPWKERKAEHLKAYKRAYMKAYMRRRRGGG